MLTSLFQRALTVSRCRRIVASSRTSSWTSVAVWITSTIAASVRCSGPDAAASLGRQQHQGRPKTLPPQTKAVLGQPIDKRIVARKLPPKEALDRFEFLGHRCIQATESLRSRRPLLAC